MPLSIDPVVEIAFASNPRDATQTWTDVTPYLQALSTRRGRQFELDQFEAGTCTVTLKNQDRRFDPAHTAGPYYPNVLPGKQIRIRAEGHYVFTGFIEAWPQTWQQQVAAQVQVRASDAVKLLNLFPLNGDYIGSVQGDRPWGYWKFDGTSLTAPDLSDASGNGNHGTWVGPNPTSSGGSPVRATSYSKYFGADYMTHTATGWTAGGFTIETWLYPAGWAGNDGAQHGIWQDRATLANAPNEIALMKHNAAPSNSLTFQCVPAGGGLQQVNGALNATNFAANTWHHIVCTASPETGLRIYLDGALLTTPTYVGTLVMPSAPPSAPRWGYSNNFGPLTGYLAHSAIFGTALRADQVASRTNAYRCYFDAQTTPQRIDSVLDVVGWPAGDRSYTGGIANLAQDSPTESAATYLQAVGASESGRLFIDTEGYVRLIGRDATLTPPYTTSRVTFGDGGPASSEIPYSDIELNFDDTRVWNEIRLERKNAGYPIVTRDPDLQATDIVRTLSRTGLLHANDAETLAAAQWLLQQYSEPVLRVEGLTIKPERDAAEMWPWALGLEIGDRVTVVRRPQHVGTAISQECYIEGIEHDYQVTATWETRFSVSRADDTAYWILGTAGSSELGTTTTLAF